VFPNFFISLKRPVEAFRSSVPLKRVVAAQYNQN